MRIHFHSGRQLQLAGSHDHFARFDAFVDDDEIALRLARFHLSQIESGIRFHNENVRTVLADLDRTARHELRVLQDVQNQPHLHELRRPERPVGIRRHAAELHRARARLNGVVDEVKLACHAARYCRPPRRSPLSGSDCSGSA